MRGIPIKSSGSTMIKKIFLGIRGKAMAGTLVTFMAAATMALGTGVTRRPRCTEIVFTPSMERSGVGPAQPHELAVFRILKGPSGQGESSRTAESTYVAYQLTSISLEPISSLFGVSSVALTEVVRWIPRGHLRLRSSHLVLASPLHSWYVATSDRGAQPPLGRFGNESIARWPTVSPPRPAP